MKKILLKKLQNSQENTYTGVSLIMVLQTGELQLYYK